MTPSPKTPPPRPGGPPPPAYYVGGSDGFRKREEIARLSAELVPPGLAALNLEQVSALSLAGGEFTARARTMPVFGPRRVLIVRDAQRGKADLVAEVLAYLARPNPDTVVLFVDEEEDPQALRRRGPSKIVEALARHRGAVRECRSPTGTVLERWIQERAGRAGKRLAPEAVQALLELAGGTLAILDQEIEKLTLFAGERGAIEREDVLAVVGDARVTGVRELTEALRRRDAAAALRAFDRLYREGVPLPYLLAALSREVSGMLRGGAGPGAEGGISRFAAPLVHRALGSLSRVDEAIKGGSTNPRLVLERALLEICGTP